MSGNGDRMVKAGRGGNGQELIKLVEQDCVDVNAQDGEGYTALHGAADRGHRNVVDILVNRLSANVLVRNNDYGTQMPIHSAAREGYYSVVEVLLTRNAKEQVDALADALYRWSPMVRWWLKQATPLHFAAFFNETGGSREIDYVKTIKLLVENGADIHAVTGPEGLSEGLDNATALHCAAYCFGHKREMAIAKCKALVDHGANLNAKDKKGRTPEQVARESPRNGSNEVADFLKDLASKKQNNPSSSAASLSSPSEASKSSAKKVPEKPAQAKSTSSPSKTNAPSAKPSINSKKKPPLPPSSSGVAKKKSEETVRSEAQLERLSQLVANGESAPLPSSRFILVGPGASGKTSTINGLVGKEFVKEHVSTQGVDTNVVATLEVHGAVTNASGGWSLVESNQADHDLGTHLLSLSHRGGGSGDGNDSAEQSSRVRIDDFVSDPNAAYQTTATAPESTSSSTATTATETTKGNEEKSRRTSLSKVVSSFVKSSFGRRASASELFAPTTKPASSKMSKPVTKSAQDASEALDKVKKDKGMQAALRQLGSWDLKDGERGQVMKLLFWDFAGQPQFRSMHDLYFTRYGFYVVVFNLEELAECLNPSAERKHNALEELRFWLGIIKIHARDTKTFLVGTHLDKLPLDSAEDLKRIDLLLRKQLEVDFNKQLVRDSDKGLQFWALDNSGTVTATDRSPALRRAIESTVSNSALVKNVEIPLSWSRTYFNLKSKATDLGRRYLSLNETQSIAQSYDIPRSQSFLMLDFFHDLGYVLYFAREPALRNLVVIEPQWLLDAFTLIIRDRDLHPYPESLVNADFLEVYGKELSRLNKSCIASESLISALWRDVAPSKETVTFLLKLMISTGLAAPYEFPDVRVASEGDADVKDNTHYIFPCIARPREDVFAELRRKKVMNRFEKVKKDQEAIRMEIEFPDLPPDGFFPRLVVSAIRASVTHSRNTGVSSESPQLTSSTAALSLGPSKFALEIVEDQSSIAVIVKNRKDALLMKTQIVAIMSQINHEFMRGNLEYEIYLPVMTPDGDEDLVSLENAERAFESAGLLTSASASTSTSKKEEDEGKEQRQQGRKGVKSSSAATATAMSGTKSNALGRTAYAHTRSGGNTDISHALCWFVPPDDDDDGDDDDDEGEQDKAQQQDFLAMVASMKNASPEPTPSLYPQEMSAKVPLPKGFKHHLFLSHEQVQGGDVVRVLNSGLSFFAGLDCWLDKTAGSEATEDGMKQGVRDSAVFLMFLTKSVFTRPFVRMELEEALSLNKPILFVHESDNRFPGYCEFHEFAENIPEDAPEGFKARVEQLIKDVNSIPYRRNEHEARAMIGEIKKRAMEKMKKG